MLLLRLVLECSHQVMQIGAIIYRRGGPTAEGDYPLAGAEIVVKYTALSGKAKQRQSRFRQSLLQHVLAETQKYAKVILQVLILWCVFEGSVTRSCKQ